MECPHCKKKIHTRSSKHNNTYYKYIVQPLADHIGYTKDEMHDIFKNEVLGFDDLKTGFRVIPGTKGMTDREFYHYCEACIRIAGEQGCVITMPGDITNQ